MRRQINNLFILQIDPGSPASMSFKYLDHQAADLIIIRKNISLAPILNVENSKYLDYNHNVSDESLLLAGPSASSSMP